MTRATATHPQHATAADVDAIVLLAFPPSRPRRSSAYMQGMRNRLCARLLGVPAHCTYGYGSTALDAFFAGCDEAEQLLKLHQEFGA